MSVRFDTSAFINGWRYHYPPATFPGVWELIAVALADGRVIAPREALNELEAKDDDVYAWAKPMAAAFVDPDGDVQREAGSVQAFPPQAGDPGQSRSVGDR